MSLPTPGSCGKQRETGKEGAGPAGTKEEKKKDKNLLKKKGLERAQGERNEAERRRSR